MVTKWIWYKDKESAYSGEGKDSTVYRTGTVIGPFAITLTLIPQKVADKDAKGWWYEVVVTSKDVKKLAKLYEFLREEYSEPDDYDGFLIIYNDFETQIKEYSKEEEKEAGISRMEELIDYIKLFLAKTRKTKKSKPKDLV